MNHVIRNFRRGAALAALFLMAAGPAAYAEEAPADELYALVAELRAEVASLRSEVAALKAEENAERAALPASPANGPVEPVLRQSEPETVVKPPIRSLFEVDFYGYIKADVFHDSARTSLQDIPYWVLNHSEGDGALDFTGRQSRFGFDIAVPEPVMDGRLTGKLELDFCGQAPGPGNLGGCHAYAVRSRHVYLKWDSERWGFLAGKTWDNYMVFLPDTLNFGYYYFQGQLGFRRMQAWGTRRWDLGGEHQLDLTLGLGEPLGGVAGGDLDTNGVDDGTDSEFPVLTAKARWRFPGLAGRQVLLSVSGFYLEEEVLDEDYTGHAVMLWAEVPLSSWLTFKGTVWTGQNLDSARGGIGQGINMDQQESVRGDGGWAQLRFQFSPKYWFNLGYSIDDPRDGDLGDGQRTHNETLLANLYWRLGDPLLLGFEYFRVATGYKRDGEQVNHRLQSALIFKF